MRRRARWMVPAVLVVLWLGVGGPLGSFAGRLADVQENEDSAFLPTSAEATRVDGLQRRFAETETLPAVVVWESADGLDEEDLARAAGMGERLAGVEGVVGPVPPPVPSQDGQALQLVVPLDAALSIDITPVVEEVRGVVAGSLPGAQVYVTGPAGILGDFAEAFGEIDGILLLVALAVVLVILLGVYRSPVLPFLVLLSSVLALGAASAAVYGLARADVITLNGQSQGILFILVVGAATDYALLLVARFREELRDHASRVDAMRAAYRAVVEPVAASGGTVILGVLCLLLSDLNSNRSLGPVAAVGIAFAMLAALTFLPAALVLLGRAAFWPFQPAHGSAHTDTRGLWAAVARLVGRHPTRTAVVTTAALLACASLVPTLRAGGVAQTDLFLTEVESVTGQEAVARHYPAGSGSPAVVVAPADVAAPALETVGADAGVADVQQVGEEVDGLVLLQAVLADPADSTAAEDTVQRLRDDLDAVSPDALVGGPTAVQLDTQETTVRDRNLIIPVILVVIFLVLALLLRSLVAAGVVLVANVLSFAATLGVSALVFQEVFGWPAMDPGVPLISFVFLVALGIDYSIFLMTRVREESLRLGTRPGVLKGLAATGGVITSAGVVLAATFAALGVIPILFLAQIAFLVAFGVLLDTIVVRSLLVPSVVHDLDGRTWWPRPLASDRAASAPAGS